MVRRLRVKIANSFGNFLFHRRKHANVREEKEEEEEEEEKEKLYLCLPRSSRQLFPM